MLLPRFGDHHHDRFLQRAAIHQQELQHVVERARVAAVRFDDREQLLQIVAEQLALGRAFAGPHPVAVAAQRVDFAVVAHEPQRLSAIPTGKRVGRKPTVHHRQMRFEIFVAQIGEVGQHLCRRQHSLVDDDLGAERADVEHQALA